MGNFDDATIFGTGRCGTGRSKRGDITVKKRICVGAIISFITLSQLFAMTVEERTFREELKTRAEMDVSYEEYRKALAKILEPNGGWDADLRYVLFPLGAIALGLVIAFFIRQIRMNLIIEARDDVSGTTQEQVATERAALARAEIAEASNDFRGALRFLYLSAILHLQERGVLPYDKSLTNREYLHQAQVNIDLQARLGPAVTVFDEVWYGHKPCDAETVADYRNLLREVYTRH